jgi:hypothetical protein
LPFHPGSTHSKTHEPDLTKVMVNFPQTNRAGVLAAAAGVLAAASAE